MTTPLTERLAAACASAILTLAILQSVALIGHPREEASSQVAQARAAASAPATTTAR